jgi:hypothetical protein
MKITLESLRSLNACDEHVDLFRKAFPRGLSVTGPSGAPRARRAIARVAAAGLDLSWFADHADLSPAALDAYARAVAPARDAYARARAAALWDALAPAADTDTTPPHPHHQELTP